MGRREGGSRGQTEKKEDKQRKRGHGKGRANLGRNARQRRQKNAECCVSRRMTVCAMCLDVLEANNEQGTGQNNSSLPFRQSVNSNLNIQPPSPGANTPAFL